jgi:hypothetical protein
VPVTPDPRSLDLPRHLGLPQSLWSAAMSSLPPPSPTPPQPPSATYTGVEITASFFFLAFILHLFKPVFTVDGYAATQRWKVPTFIPLAPGQHQVQVHFPYLILPTAGKAVMTVTLQPGQVLRLGYRAPWLVFMPGKLKLI